MFSMGSCPAQPIFSLNRVHELPNYFYQYMHEVTIKHYDKLKFTQYQTYDIITTGIIIKILGGEYNGRKRYIPEKFCVP